MGFIGGLILLTTLFTGFSGLVYEVAWQKYLANILGSQAQATALVLAVFLGGLALGYQLFGRLSRQRSARSLVKMTGWAEVVIGLWAFFFDAIFAFVMDTFGIIDPSKSYAVLTDVLISVIVIGCPTVLMGVTLPLLTQALSSSLKSAGWVHARIYSVNTAGAFLGCLFAGFFFLPKLGLPLTMLYMSCANFAAGFILVFVARYLSSEIPDNLVPDAAVPERVAEEPGQLNSLLLLKVIALVAGFCALTIQTAFIRLTGLTMGSSEYAFSMVVAAYILLLAIGAWRIAAREDKNSSLARNQLIAALGLVAVLLSMNYWPYGFHLVRIVFSHSFIGFYAYHIVAFLIMLAVLYVPVGAMGRTMPLLFRSSTARLGAVGNDVGTIYGWNAIGCVAGAYFGGYFFYYYLNIDHLLKLCITLLVLTSVMAIPAILKKQAGTKVFFRWVPAATVLAALFAAVLPGQDKDRFAFGLFRMASEIPETLGGAEKMHEVARKNNETIFYKDGPTGSVAVLERKVIGPAEAGPEKDALVRSLIVNGKSDGATCCGDKRTVQLLAHIPGMLHNGKSGNVAVVGFGTGLSAGSFSLYDEIRQIDIYEISPTIRDIAPYFDFANGNVTKDPKMSWTLGDAFRSLSSTEKTYSIIMSEPSNPWVAGVERLFTQDFYRLALKKLEPGGVYAQWFHLYSMSADTVGLVINTFATVFPHIRVFALAEGELCMVGSMDPIDGQALSRMEQRYAANPKVQEQLREIEIPGVDALLGQEYAVGPGFFAQSGIHSLDIPQLSYAAGIDFFMQKSVDFTKVLTSNTAIAWHKKYYNEALLAQKYPPERIAGLSDDEARKLISDACQIKGDTVNIGQVVGFGRRFCVPMFWSVISAKGEVDQVTVGEDAKKFVTGLSNPSQIPDEISTETATSYLTAVSDVASTGFALARASVDKLANACGTEGDISITCRLNVVKARIAMLDADGASTQLGALKASEQGKMVREEVYEELETAIRAASGKF